jgi:hypothetical protein
MCILQLTLVTCYVVASGLEYFYRRCSPRNFRLLHGRASIEEWRFEQEEGCAICFESMSGEDMLLQVNKCKHLFHFSCIKEWNNNYNQTCPTCRGGIGTIYD